MGLGQHPSGQLVSGEAIQPHSLDTLTAYPSHTSHILGGHMLGIAVAPCFDSVHTGRARS